MGGRRRGREKGWGGGKRVRRKRWGVGRRRKGWGGEARMNDKNSIGEEKGKDKRRGQIQSTEVKGVAGSVLDILLSEEWDIWKGPSDVLIDALFQFSVHKILMPRALHMCVHLCVCMCMCICVCMSVCVHVCMSMHMCRCVCTGV